MKPIPTFLSALITVATGCVQIEREGVYFPEGDSLHNYESLATFVLLDDLTQGFVTQAGPTVEKRLEDGRLEVVAALRNRKDFPIRVQVNCVFKTYDGIATGDATPFQSVLLDPNETQSLRFVSFTPEADAYTVRVRRPR